MITQSAFLLDSSIYIFRGWHTLPDTLVDNDNHPINAVCGFTDTLAYLVEQKPDYLICAFDQNKTNCWRREIDPKYKANRPEAPPELRQQFAMCQRFVELAGLPAFVSNRYEADDIIGTFSRLFHQHDIGSAIITADKDLTQLVQTLDIWWDVIKNRQLDRKGVEKQWGVLPERIPDLLALCGDKVDNIEGIPGIGPKTAANLLVKFDSLEHLFDNAEAVGVMRFRGAVRIKNLLKMHHEKARLARRLTPILDCPEMPNNIAQLTPAPYQAEALDDFMQHLQFDQIKRNRWHRALSALHA